MPTEINWLMIGMVIIYMLVGAVSVPVKYVWDDITDSPFTITKKHVRGYLYTGAWLGFVTATLSSDLYAFSNLGACAIIGLSAGPVLSLMVSAGTMLAARMLKIPTLMSGIPEPNQTQSTLDDSMKELIQSQQNQQSNFPGLKEKG